MSILHPNAPKVAREYIGRGPALEALGYGIDGDVFHLPESHTVVKILATAEKFDREIVVYRRLKKRRVTAIQGFSVPQLLGYSARHNAIRMSFVRPPFLLDFVQTKLDQRPDFPEGLDEWWDRLGAIFEERLPIVQSVFYELLNRHGIYYYDLKPGNLEFGPNWTDQTP
jgi:hypothetical protein